ncbi:hypothetical protein Dthio_PD1607 [Desulfonatronospira thiodismutans ASO3-1]|uniref:DUF2171 domain-containing protein n=1 Tax=Desulfonatronospira thiodismutans ASO3-1 TaxID=555779 RepID=D6SND0_9BACT|nr:hypothetical protein [Desulfonatronospira thiodismutans]EFI34256.1 hypothetical protein Dthio_PD1607 [Desulfonatronospira thiodismutans ASO3-1]
MTYELNQELCLHNVAGCPLMLPDGTAIGTVEGVKKHKGGCEVWMVRTEEDRQIMFPIYEEIVVECSPDEHVVVDPPADLLQMYMEGKYPENPCRAICRFDLKARREAMATGHSSKNVQQHAA